MRMKAMTVNNAHQSVVAACLCDEECATVIKIENPTECLAFWPQLTANPFQSMLEALKMITSPSSVPSSLMVCKHADRVDLVRTEFGTGPMENLTPFLLYHQWLALSEIKPVGAFIRVMVSPNRDNPVTTALRMLSLESLDKMDPYRAGIVEATPLAYMDRSKFLAEAELLTGDGPLIGFSERWIRRVAVPVVQAWNHIQACQEQTQGMEGAALILTSCEAKDWKFACEQWLVKRGLL